jgi:hypothetical protein
MRLLQRKIARFICSWGLFIAVVSMASHADAKDDIEVRAVLHTDFPVLVGAGADVELPYRLRTATSMGWMPPGYLEASNGVLVPMFEDQGYGEAQADLVESALDNALVWRTTIGWRPFDKLGFVFGAGYTLAALGGQATAAQIIEGATGQEVPETDQEGSGALDFDLGATVHQVHVDVGWQWSIAKGLWIKTGIGWGFTVASSSSVEARYQPRRPAGQRALDAFEREGEAYLDDTITSYVHPPHIGLAIGWSWEL